MPARTFSMAVIVAVALICISPTQAQQRIIIGQDEPPLTSSDRAAIVDSLCVALDRIYVFPEDAENMEKLLRKHLKDGEYDDLTTRGDFTDKLTEDMHSVRRDLHLRVHPIPPQPPGQEPDPEEQRRQMLEERRYQNYDFYKVERLPGNIGYLDLHGFNDAGIAGATAVAAMNFLANCDALIIDLRWNGGGHPSMIQLICSYFFEEPVHLNSFYIRRDDSMKQFWTQAHVEGPKMVDTPIYVLTSGNTFSAAEEFTYNLKNLERATIIGETTGGGAHPVDFAAFHDLGVGASIPFGRAVNPITGTNWEGTGIEPHIQVPMDEALTVARMEALKHLMEQADTDERKQRLTWVLGELEAVRNPVTLTESELQDFVGTYGPRTIRIEDGVLYYKRESRPEFKMIPMGEDRFMLEGLGFFRIQFERDGSGKVVKLIGLYANGQQDSHTRSGD